MREFAANVEEFAQVEVVVGVCYLESPPAMMIAKHEIPRVIDSSSCFPFCVDEDVAEGLGEREDDAERKRVSPVVG